MKWLLKRGDNLETSATSHASAFFCANFWPGEKRETDLTLFSSEEVKAPRRLKSRVSS